VAVSAGVAFTTLVSVASEVDALVVCVSAVV